MPVNVKTPKKKKGTAISESTVRFRKGVVTDADAWIVDYSFDTEEELWCEVSGGRCKICSDFGIFFYYLQVRHFINPRKGSEKK